MVEIPRLGISEFKSPPFFHKTNARSFCSDVFKTLVLVFALLHFKAKNNSFLNLK